LLRAGLKSGHRVLDVAIGTGLIASSAQQIVGPRGTVTVLLLEVSSPSGAIYRTTLARYLGRGVLFLSYWITRQPKVRTLMTYHWETMKDRVPPSAIIDAIESAEFTRVVSESWFDMFRSYTDRKSEA
jgi:hypothetical protein